MDATMISLLVAALALGLGVGIAYGRQRQGPAAGPSEIWALIKDSEARLLILTLVGLAVGLSAALWLIARLLRGSVDAGMAAMVGGVIGIILTSTLTGPWGYWFGSSKGSADKSKASAEVEKIEAGKP